MNSEEADIRKILEWRSAGVTYAEIGRRLGRSKWSVIRAWKKHGGRAPADFESGSPPPNPGAEVRTEGPDTVSVDVRSGDERSVTLEEIRRENGLGPEWIASHFTDNAWEGFYKLKSGAEHRVVPLRQRKAVFRRIVGDETRRAIVEWARETCPTRPAPGAGADPREAGCVVSWGLWDAHVGMYAYGREVGRDYDVRIAERRIRNSIDDMVAELRPYRPARIWMPIGNDFMHYDGIRQRTTRGEHDLDCDSRATRAHRVALVLLVYMVEAALELGAVVDGFWIPGNHDYYASYALLAAVDAYFRLDPRVRIDLGDCPQKIRRHGKVAVLFDHGDKVPAARYPVIFHEHVLSHAAREGLEPPEYKEVQIGHTHQKRDRRWEGEVPANGVRVVTNPALCHADYWHFSQGFIGEPPSVEARRYDETGLRGTHVVWARD